MFELLYKLIIGPLNLYFEIIYSLASKLLIIPGLILFSMSLAVSFICLPFYRRAEAIQINERNLEKSMEKGISHIKKTFSGDEQFLMLQTFYRISHYHPIYILKSFIPLALQIPFFIAAYRFISNLDCLVGASFGPIIDLSKPDRLFSVNGIGLNILPVIMTIINVISSSIYAQDHTRREKIQLYTTALIFLALLYNSPSGLVLYWTYNNIFSLVRNLIDKSKNCTFIRGAVFSGLAAFFFMTALMAAIINGEYHIWAYAISVILLIAAFSKSLGPQINKWKRILPSFSFSSRWFFSGSLLLTFLVGILIPTEVIKSSPAEFVILSAYKSPLLYIADSVAIATGLFIVWFGFFYYLSTPRMKKIFNVLILVFCGIAIINYLFFGTNLGTISEFFQYEQTPVFSINELIANFSCMIATAFILIIIWCTSEKSLRMIVSVMVVVIIGMCGLNFSSITSSLNKINKISQNTDQLASYTLSKDKNNVIVIMLDKAVSSFIPYLFQEKPELKKQFDGFTWYPNTITYGWCTNIGSPAIYGGYEYTPEEMNKRNNEMLSNKHNEALKVMPVLFDQAGFDVTVSDAPYAGYSWIPDLSIYNDYSSIKTYLTQYGQFRYLLEEYEAKDNTKDIIWKRNFFYYSFMKIMPLAFQNDIYQNGKYLNTRFIFSGTTEVQYLYSASKATGINSASIDSFAALKALPEITNISTNGKGSFLMLYNCTAHDPMLYQEPEYIPSLTVDNTEYDSTHKDRFIYQGSEMTVKNELQMRYYHSNMAALIQLGNWFDHMRNHNVYDNTRIIIVADHGANLNCFEDFVIADNMDLMYYNPLLLVKDFNCTGFHTDYQFMTNADTPTIAFNELIDNPVNPFTGKHMTNTAKFIGTQHVLTSGSSFKIDVNNGTTFLPGEWWAVHDNALNKDDWSYLGNY